MPRSISYIVILIILAPMHTALGASRGLLYLGNLKQGIDFDYRYTNTELSGAGRQTSKTSTSLLEERYHLNFAYAIYDPKIWRGEIAAGVRFNQDWESGAGSTSSGTATNYDHSITGHFFSEKPINILLSSGNGTTYSTRLFANSYETTTDKKTVGVFVKNRFVPVQLTYAKIETATDGLQLDTKQTSNQFLLSASNTYEMSHTVLQINHLNNELSYKDKSIAGNLSKSYSLAVNNTITLSSNLSRALYSDFQRSESAGTNPENTMYWKESLMWDFGKALQSNISYNLSDVQSPVQRQVTNSGQAWLQHRLFQSLTTRLTGNYSQRDYNASGTEKVVGGIVNVTYIKKLPESSELQVLYREGYQITDRKLADSRILVLDESHLAPSLTGTLQVANTFGLVPSSITIRNADTTNSYNIGGYSRSTDFTVDSFGNIAVVPTGAIVPGTDNLLVSYFYQVSPSVKLSTTSRRVDAALSLFSVKYRIYGSRDYMAQEQLANQSGSSQLDYFTTYRLGVDCNLTPHTFGGLYVNQDSVQDKYQSMEGYWTFTQYFESSSLSLRLRDRYVLHAETSLYPGVGSYSENLLNAGANYTRPLYRIAQLILSADYSNSVGRDIVQNHLTLSMNLRARLQKLHVSLSCATNLLLTDGRLNRHDNISLRVSRDF